MTVSCWFAMSPEDIYILYIHTLIYTYVYIYIYIHTYINIHDLHLRMFGLLTSQDLYAVGGAGAWNCWGA
jgi:hypothetical protein